MGREGNARRAGHQVFRSAARAAAFFAAYHAVLDQWPVPVEPVDVPSRFGTTRVNVCGPRSAPPLVLLHGGGATSTVWFSTVGELTQKRRVYAIDQIGDPGASVNNGDAISGVSDYMSWLDSTLDGLQVTRADMCGHSYGGWLALNYALHAENRVGRLALLAPTACFSGMRLSYRIHAIPLFVAPSAQRMRAFLRWETGGRRLDPAWVDLVARGAAQRWSKTVLPRRPPADQLQRLRTPTLVVLAEHDKSHNNRNVERTARRLLPNISLIVLAGATHHTMPNEDGPQLAPELVRFLT